MSRASKVKRTIVHLFCLIYIVITLFPLVWMVISGFKTDSDLFSSPWSIPSEWQISNYFYVWTNYIQKSVLNSLFFTVVGTFFVVLISGFAAYAIIRFQFLLNYIYPFDYLFISS